MNDHPASGSTVRRDLGGWISGPSVTVETVPAADVRAGDVLVLPDGCLAEVTDTRTGTYWLASGYGPGAALGWRSRAGTASGVLFRRTDDIVHRVVTR
ncbi:MAG: hypothetical protein ACR2FU_25275 [Streptosporangiaceae bacterium]